MKKSHTLQSLLNFAKKNSLCKECYEHLIGNCIFISMLHDNKMCKHSSCVSYSSYCCAQSLTRSNVKEGKFILVYILMRLLHCGRKDTATRARSLLVLHHPQSGCRDKHSWSANQLFFLKHFEAPVHEMVLPTFRIGLLTSVN